MRKPVRAVDVVMVQAVCKTGECGWMTHERHGSAKGEVHLQAKAHAASKHHFVVVTERVEIGYDSHDPG